MHSAAAQATASGGEVASLKSSASRAASAASSSRPSRRMIIECRQLACATMLIEPRRRASASTVSQIRPAVLELARPDERQQRVHRGEGIGRDARPGGHG